MKTLTSDFIKSQAPGQTQTLPRKHRSPKSRLTEYSSNKWSLVKVPNLPLTANLNLDVAAHGHQDTGVILQQLQKPSPIAANIFGWHYKPTQSSGRDFFFLLFFSQSLQAESLPGYRLGNGFFSQPSLCINSTFAGALEEFCLFGAPHSTSNPLKAMI